jgi:hypothetical protein
MKNLLRENHFLQAVLQKKAILPVFTACRPGRRRALDAYKFGYQTSTYVHRPSCGADQLHLAHDT